MREDAIQEILAGIRTGAVIPYLGPGVLSLGAQHSIPENSLQLVARLIAQSQVPGKLRKNLTGAAQFIENFKHRMTLRRAMTAAFQQPPEPNVLHRFVAEQTQLRMVVCAWYDTLLCTALASRSNWMFVQGASRADRREIWYQCFDADGAKLSVARADSANDGALLVYAPFGSAWPEENYLVSDSDFVEVLTEIDIQTPIPPAVQQLRSGRNFLFLGCRFNTQLERQFAHQIMKRSSDRHWAVLPEEPTKNEAHFLELYGIERIALPLEEFVAHLSGSQQES
jgi:hypothetical protein